MERHLTIRYANQEINFSDLDGENELKVSTIDIDNRRTVIWLSIDDILSIKKHLDYILNK